MTATGSETAQAAGDHPVHFYGVVRAGEDHSSLADLDVTVVEEDGLAAVVSSHGDEPVRPSRQARRHRSVLDALAAAGAVVPARFGTVLEGEQDVRAVLREERDRWAAELDRVQGRRQFRVRALYDEERVLREIVTEDPRIAALREATQDLPPEVGHGDRVRLGELVSVALGRHRAEDRARVLDAIEPLVVDRAEHERGEIDHVLDVFVLVENTARGDFEGGLEELAAALHPRIRLQLTGPMAPYEFVGGDTWA
ncbi:GvpL/GvpF family gas vesicle protein [Nocardioidaceae bacterium]|nr:GvpL/GvpF family gas vesicle protein [Nocardioidaceae bacterium]